MFFKHKKGYHMNIKYKLITTKNKLFDRKAIEYWEGTKVKLTKAARALGFQVVPEQDNSAVAEEAEVPRPAGIASLSALLIRPTTARQPAHAITEVERISKSINATIKNSRDQLKELRSHPEFLQEIHLTSEKKWDIIPEFFNEETGKTEYGPNDGSQYIKDKEQLNKYTSEEGRYRFNGKPNKFTVDIHLPYTRENGTKIKEVVKEAQGKAVQELKEYRKLRQTIPSIEKELPKHLQLMQGLPEEFNPSYKLFAGGGYGNQSEDGRFGNERYFIHMEKGTFVKLGQVGKLRRVFEAKKPRTRDNHVGVEIEFVSKYNKYELAQLLYKNDVHEFVQLVQDESLRPEKEFKFTHELTVLAPEPMIHAVLQRVLRAINENDGSRVAKRCGLHVHLDMRHRDRKRCFNNLTKSQTIMYNMNPVSRLNGKQADGKQDTVYSKRIDIYDIDEAIKQCNATGGREARYYGINPLALDRHQTIEVRIHSGSTNFDKISNWVKILTAIVNSEDNVKKEFTKVEEFCEQFKLDTSMYKYIEERMAKFKDKSGKHISVDEVA
jgi:hypothetical protein